MCGNECQFFVFFFTEDFISLNEQDTYQVEQTKIKLYKLYYKNYINTTKQKKKQKTQLYNIKYKQSKTRLFAFNLTYSSNIRFGDLPSK